MLKTISAALLAVSMLAVPALANAGTKTHAAPAIKSVQVKSSVLNANARMGHHHHRHGHHHHRHHGHR
jgi:ribosomal protein L21